MNVRIDYLPLGRMQFEILELVLGALLQRYLRPEGNIGYPPVVHILRCNGEDSVRLPEQSRICGNANSQVNENAAVTLYHGAE